MIRTWYGVTRCGAGAVHDFHSPDSEGSPYTEQYGVAALEVDGSADIDDVTIKELASFVLSQTKS